MSSDNDTNPSGVATNEGEESRLAPSLNEDSGLDLILHPDLLSVRSNSQSAYSSGNTTPETEMLLTVPARSASGGSSDVTPDAERPFSGSSFTIPASVSSAITDSQSSLSSTSSFVPPRDKSVEDGGSRQVGTGSSGNSDYGPSPFGSCCTIAEFQLPIKTDLQLKPFGSSGTIPTSEISIVTDTTGTIPTSKISIIIDHPSAISTSEISTTTDPQSRPFDVPGTGILIELPITDPKSIPFVSSASITTIETDPQSRPAISAVELPMIVDPQSSLVSTSDVDSPSSDPSTVRQLKLPNRPTSIGGSLRRTYHKFSTENSDGILEAKTFKDAGVKKIRMSELDIPLTTTTPTPSTSTLSSRESGSTNLSKSSSAESCYTSSSNLTGGSSDTPEDTTKDDWYRIMRARGPRVKVSGTIEEMELAQTGTIQETEFEQGATGDAFSTAEAGKFLSVPGDVCKNIYFGRLSPSLNEEEQEGGNKQNQDMDDSDGNRNTDA